MSFDPAVMSRLWRSPIRGPWLTSVLGAALLVGIPVEFITGLVSWASYEPRLTGNQTTPHHGVLSFYLFEWVTSPSWIYRVSQGTHVLLGLALTPILLAKLWSVIPLLFSWPPLRSLAHMLERASLLLLVGGAIFEFTTGVMNIDYDYSFGFSFYDGHFIGAWLFITGFVIHAALKTPQMWRSLRSRSLRSELRTGLADTRPEPSEGRPGGLVAAHPAAPTISRRAALATVGGSSLAVFLLTAGQSIRALRPSARGQYSSVRLWRSARLLVWRARRAGILRQPRVSSVQRGRPHRSALPRKTGAEERRRYRRDRRPRRVPERACGCRPSGSPLRSAPRVRSPRLDPHRARRRAARPCGARRAS